MYLGALLKKLRRETARRDILFFAKYYLGHIVSDDIPDFHREIYALVQDETRLGIAAPRGFAKSTIVQIVYGMWCLLFNEEDDILTISQSQSLAEDWVRKIKFELEGNDKIKEDFGGILDWGERKSKRWTATHIVIHKGEKVFSQMRARGRGCQVRGLRPTRVFCDDLEDDELVRSDDQRKILKDWFLMALLNVLRTDQQLVVIGTVLHPLALLPEIIDKKDMFEGWTTKKYQALTNNYKDSLWPQRFPATELLKRKFEIGTYAFESEFQNNPITSDICLWREHWLVRYDTHPRIGEVFIGIDPATSTKESADYTGIVVWGLGEDGKIYELESVKGRWGTWDFVDRLIKIHQKYDPVKMGIEHEKISMVMRPVILEEARRRGVYMRLQSIKLGSYKQGERRESRDKFSRAMTVIHMYEQDLIRLKSQDLIDELATFPTGSSDDLVDASVHGLHLIQRYSTKAQVFNKVRAALNPFKAAKSFEMKPGNRIEPFVKIEECFEQSNDWRIGN